MNLKSLNMGPNSKWCILATICCVPPAYLVVLLWFDVKYLDVATRTFSVPIYPLPVYLKLSLAVVCCCIVCGLLAALRKARKGKGPGTSR